jgi:hypothetical protein
MNQKNIEPLPMCHNIIIIITACICVVCMPVTSLKHNRNFYMILYLLTDTYWQLTTLDKDKLIFDYY